MLPGSYRPVAFILLLGCYFKYVLPQSYEEKEAPIMNQESFGHIAAMQVPGVNFLPCRQCTRLPNTVRHTCNNRGRQDRGDSCTDDSGHSGVCKPIEDCVEARRNLDNGITPKICSYHKLMPIICCIAGNPIQLKRKSEQKCMEYANLTFSKDEAATPQEDGKELNTFPNDTLEIIGGNAALPKEFPHMAAVGYGEENNISWLCGGSLISEQFVLTAAHCIASKLKGLARWVRLGDLNLVRTDDPVETQQFAVEHLYRHPDYEPPARYNDIALLKLDHNVIFTDFVRPACIHTEEDLPNVTPEAIGWGLVEWGTSNFSEDLLKVSLNYIDMEYCNRTYAPLEGGRKLNRGIDEQTMLCVGDLEGGKDTCQGDSGGPLHLRLGESNSTFDIIGITSFGSACGSKNSPAIYTKVSHFIPWIESIVWP